MNLTKNLSLFLICMITLAYPLPSIGQGNPETDKIVGGGCEDCKALFDFGSQVLASVDTLPDFDEKGPKLEISGTIYKKDGKTPAKDVILYIYHTDQKGEYSNKNTPLGKNSKHGYIRGWIKTGADGKYAFYTLRPKGYPGGQNPEHIHPIIKEPGIREYWIDEFLFDDDPALSARERNHQQGRGGLGIVSLQKGSRMLIGKRDIILGRNIPDYD